MTGIWTQDLLIWGVRSTALRYNLCHSLEDIWQDWIRLNISFGIIHYRLKTGRCIEIKASGFDEKQVIQALDQEGSFKGGQLCKTLRNKSGGANKCKERHRRRHRRRRRRLRRLRRRRRREKQAVEFSSFWSRSHRSNSSWWIRFFGHLWGSGWRRKGGGKRHKDMETFSHQVVAAGTTEAALDPDKKLTHFDCGNKNAWGQSGLAFHLGPELTPRTDGFSLQYSFWHKNLKCFRPTTNSLSYSIKRAVKYRKGDCGDGLVVSKIASWIRRSWVQL